MKRRINLILLTIFSSILLLPASISACNEGDEHGSGMGNTMTGMVVADGTVASDSTFYSQAKEVVWWINSLLLTLLMLAGIYWLIKNAGNKINSR